MTKPEWGKKRTCQSCGKPFYDLKRKTVACPKCGAPYDPVQPVKAKRAAPPAPAPVAKPVPVPANDALPDDDADDADVAVDDDDEDEDASPAAPVGGLSAKKAGGGEESALIEDASDLGEDEDDIGEVKEHIDDGIGDKP